MTYCVPGCRLEDDHDQPDGCMTAEDFRDERALRRWEDDCQDRGWTTRRGAA